MLEAHWGLRFGKAPDDSESLKLPSLILQSIPARTLQTQDMSRHDIVAHVAEGSAAHAGGERCSGCRRGHSHGHCCGSGRGQVEHVCAVPLGMLGS